MDPITSFVSAPFVIFSLAIAAMVYPFRLVIDYCLKNSTKLPLWDSVILPIVPIPIGAVLAYLIPMFPFPDGWANVWPRVLWGSVAGLLSTTMYRITWALLKDKVQSYFSNNPPIITTNDPLGRARNPVNPRLFR
jgi:hypothetical protein